MFGLRFCCCVCIGEEVTGRGEIDSELLEQHSTSIRWFGPDLRTAPRNHQEPTRVDTPVDEDCAACGSGFHAGSTGFTIPHVDAESYVPRPYHPVCFYRILGLQGYVDAALEWNFPEGIPEG